ncbi:MAG: low temperature requirement protein A [Microthrixaceae bacterium]
MRGIEVPERTEDFTADPVELFFDLAYVFAFSQLVGRLVHDPDWAGVGHVVLLFLLLWLPWQQFTWSANAVSGNGRTVRIFFLVATVASVPMAASVSTAFGTGGPVFAVPLAVIMLIGLATMLLGIETGTAEWSSALRWASPNLLAVAVLVAGAFVPEEWRVVIWSASVLVTFAAMVAAGRGQWIIRTGHFAERHGLIVIIALGEVIVALGLPVVASLEGGEGIPGRTVLVLVASGAFAGLLWWSTSTAPPRPWSTEVSSSPRRVTGGASCATSTRGSAPFVLVSSWRQPARGDGCTRPSVPPASGRCCSPVSPSPW